MVLEKDYWNLLQFKSGLKILIYLSFDMPFGTWRRADVVLEFTGTGEAWDGTVGFIYSVGAISYSIYDISHK